MSIFYLPDLGEGLMEAEIRTWHVKEGDSVTIDQILVSLETAKAVVDVPSPTTGKITTLFGKENEIVATGAPLIEFEVTTTTQNELPQPKKHSVVGSLEESDHQWEELSVDASLGAVTAAAVKALPAARALAQQHHVDLKLIQASSSGFITKNDVQRYLDQHTSPKIQSDHTKTEPLRGAKRTMALAMVQSQQQIVPVTILEDIECTFLPIQFDITIALIKSIVHAAQHEPALNAWFDGATLEKKLFSDVHIGIAVDAKEGLFVPVVKNAQSLNDNQLRTSINHYKTAAQERTLSPPDLQGASITLSNFGTIAGKYANPIIVPPTVAIIGTGKIRSAPIVDHDAIVAGHILPISLTFDHRAVSGGEATRFLSAFIKQFTHLIKTHF